MVLDGWCLQVLGVLSENFRTMNLFYYVHCNSASLLSILNYGNERLWQGFVRWYVINSNTHAQFCIRGVIHLLPYTWILHTYVSQIECRKWNKLLYCSVATVRGIPISSDKLHIQFTSNRYQLTSFDKEIMCYNFVNDKAEVQFSIRYFLRKYVFDWISFEKKNHSFQKL